MTRNRSKLHRSKSGTGPSPALLGLIVHTFCKTRFGMAAFAIVAALLAFHGTAHAEKRVALVIGNNAYSTLPPLQKAVGDAEVVGDTLARLGFDVIRGRNLSRQGTIDKLAELTAKLGPGDIAAFFYAGHGVAIDNVNYLVPTDVPAATSGVRVRGASIAEGDVIAEIQAKGVRVALIVLDACRNNPFPKAAGRSIGSTRGLADAKPARGVFTIYSAGIGQEALDRLEPNDSNRNSVFTRIFAEYLAKPDMDLSQLAVEVRERVYQLALKARNEAGMPEPHEQTPAYYDQTIGGRVYLAGRTADPRPRPEREPTPQSSAAPPKPAPSGWLTSWLAGMGFGGAPKPEPAPRTSRLELVLVASDPAMAPGPPLHDYGNGKTTYKIERSITFPGDIEGFSAILDAMQRPAIDIAIAPAALERINRTTDLVGRQIALVLDGRTVLSAAVLREPLGRRMQLTGNFSLDDITRLVNAISLTASVPSR